MLYAIRTYATCVYLRYTLSNTYVILTYYKSAYYLRYIPVQPMYNTHNNLRYNLSITYV